MVKGQEKEKRCMFKQFEDNFAIVFWKEKAKKTHFGQIEQKGGDMNIGYYIICSANMCKS